MLAPHHLALRCIDVHPRDAAAEFGFPYEGYQWLIRHPEWCWEEITPLERAMSVEVAVAQLLAMTVARSPILLTLGHRLCRQAAVIRELGSLGLYKPYSILRSGSLFRAPRPCSNPQLVALITPLLQEHQEESWEPQTPDSLGSCLFLLVKTSFHSSLGWPPSAGKQVGGQPFSKFALYLPFWLMFANHWLSWSILPLPIVLECPVWPTYCTTLEHRRQLPCVIP